MKHAENVTINVCPRCGASHVMAMTPLTNPHKEFGSWGMCPIMREPVFMQVIPPRANDVSIDEVLFI